MSCGLLEANWSLGGIYHQHLQNLRVNQEGNLLKASRT
jgi:hypothetical protein